MRPVELSPAAGRFLTRALSRAPRFTRPFAWPETGRIGLDPAGAMLFCVRWRGRRVELAFAER